ncbi:hypothetical protein H2203_004978 [Taxawa tesnikishii (nom. ined.)]|nr:hypothetical protein H2203_004978 [Dothideales sp. JES 119]
MPAMFSRRSRTPSNTRNNAPPSSSAAIAASSAFLKSSTSTASLSSAAAAAALRSHTTSPEPVGNLQTKRMIRRGSQSSVGSGSIMGGAGRGISFAQYSSKKWRRITSSGRAASSGATEEYASEAKEIRKPRTSHARLFSYSTQRRKEPTVSSQRASTLQQVPEQQREERQESVNFSRPISTPQSTPPVSPIQRPTTSGAWFTSPAVSNAAPRATSDQRPKTSDGLSSHEVSTIQQSIQSAADQPVAKKKKKTAATNEGKHLANGTLAPAPQGTTVSSPVAAQPVQSVEAPATPIQKKKPVTPAIDTNVPDVPPPRNPARLSPGAEEGEARELLVSCTNNPPSYEKIRKRKNQRRGEYQ